MKSFLFILAFFTTALHAQSGLPEATVEDMDANRVNTSVFSNDGKPMIISFWATWCKPCLKELAAIEEVYEEWAEETGVKLIAISVDDSRSAPRVRSFVLGSGWEYEVYLDQNGDFKRAMNVVNIPHTFLIDGDGNIVYQHTSYAPGDEEDLFEKIKALVE
ncbi:MAG: TlpA family protein disulfide reductase [Bacteroidia bacterium]|nr:TlpA family protein disulfide reductase [Bacteroidia bacterium]